MFQDEAVVPPQELLNLPRLPLRMKPRHRLLQLLHGAGILDRERLGEGVAERRIRTMGLACNFKETVLGVPQVELNLWLGRVHRRIAAG